MKKIFLYVISFLLMIFPNSVSLQGSYQGLMYPGDKVVCDTIAKAIKSDDIEGIYNMFCDEGKNNNPKLSKHIDELVNSVEGKILTMEKSAGLGSSSEYHNYDKQRESRDFVLQIVTDKQSYLLYIFWVNVDTECPEKVGLSGLNLFDSDRNLLYSAY